MAIAEKGQRLLDAAVAILEVAPANRLNITLLNKALFYLDLVALRDFGDTITGNVFVALEHGPAVAHYQKRLVKKLEKAGLAKQIDEDESKPVVLCKGAKSASLNDEEKALIERVTENVVRHIGSSKKSSDYSHENLGWQIAYAAGQKKGLAAKPIDLNVALQQITEPDPWVDAPFEPAVAQSVKREDPTAREW
jgi:hypothetical protein